MTGTNVLGELYHHGEGLVKLWHDEGVAKETSEVYAMTTPHRTYAILSRFEPIDISTKTFEIWSGAIFHSLGGIGISRVF